MTSSVSPASSCFVHIPYTLLEAKSNDFLARGLQPEISLEGEVLYQRSLDDHKRLADRLRQAGRACTLHAPFFDLAPGGLDPHIREASRAKLRLAFGLLAIFRPAAIVCHLGFESNKHGYKFGPWLEHSLATWRELLGFCQECSVPLMLENTYETSPEVHHQVLTALDSPLARFCLDTGHLLSFAKTDWQHWLPALAPWLGHLHLHDNLGDRDAHLVMGDGRFDFDGLLRFLTASNLSPTVTLEIHRPAEIDRGLRAFAERAAATGFRPGPSA